MSRTPHDQQAKGRTIAVVGDVYRFLATGEDMDGKYALWETIVPPGGGPPPHVHSREEEGFYVLEGEITFTVNGERVVATAGTFANMPVGTPHSFKNENDRPARMLISVAPAGLEKMFFECGVPLAEGPRPPSTDEGRDRFWRLLGYGIESGCRGIEPTGGSSPALRAYGSTRTASRTPGIGRWRARRTCSTTAALLEDSEGRPVTRGGGGDQRTFGDFPQQQVEGPAGDAHPPIRPVDPVPDVIPAVYREARDVPDQRLAEENGSGGDRRNGQCVSPMRVECLPGPGDRDRHAVRLRVELHFVHAGQVARLNRTESNGLVGGPRPVAVAPSHRLGRVLRVAGARGGQLAEQEP